MPEKNEPLTSRADPELQRELLSRLPPDAPRKLKSRLATAFLFFEHGIYPSAKVVREYIQQGSLTDINKDLREFWQELREKSRVQIDAPSLPPDLLAGFGDGLSKLWELALGKAQVELEAFRQEAAESVAQSQLEVQAAVREQRRAEEDLAELDLELRQERERREQAEIRVEAQGAEMDALKSSLAKWQQQAADESAARLAAEERFSRELEVERAERRLEAERFNGESRFAKIQIDKARTEARELREQMNALSSSKEVELTTYRQRLNKAEEARGAAILELAELKGRLRAMEQQLVTLQESRLKAQAERPRPPSRMKPLVKRRTLR